MPSYFLSDLHLTPERPAVAGAFMSFLANQAPHAERVYVLGDLFEYWIGDDAASLVGAEPILAAMRTLADKVDCCFIAGNRDFLVGQQFEQASGFSILPDESVIDLYGTPTLLLHGDSLCIDDIAHQQFREEIVTNLPRREAFLSLPIPERIEQAKQARMQSDEHKSGISMEIMDVTESAVLKAFEDHSVTQMIHGHTHRQNVHHYQTNAGTCERYVLGDWHNSASILTADDSGSLKINNVDI